MKELEYLLELLRYDTYVDIWFNQVCVSGCKNELLKFIEETEMDLGQISVGSMYVDVDEGTLVIEAFVVTDDGDVQKVKESDDK